MNEKLQQVRSALGFVIGTIASSYYTPEELQDHAANKLGIPAKLLVDSSAILGGINSFLRVKGSDLGEIASKAAENHETLQSGLDLASVSLLVWAAYGAMDNAHRVYMNHAKDRQVPGAHFRVLYSKKNELIILGQTLIDGFEDYAKINGFNNNY